MNIWVQFWRYAVFYPVRRQGGRRPYAPKKRVYEFRRTFSIENYSLYMESKLWRVAQFTNLSKEFYHFCLGHWCKTNRIFEINARNYMRSNIFCENCFFMKNSSILFFMVVPTYNFLEILIRGHVCIKLWLSQKKCLLPCRFLHRFRIFYLFCIVLSKKNW